jgi:hypothetical protein
MRHIIMEAHTEVIRTDVDSVNAKCALLPKGALVCLHCGERFPMPGGRLEWVADVIEAFQKQHAECRKEKNDRNAG